MASRMDRYYNNENESKRTNKNINLYDNIYEDKEYENVEKLNLNVGKEIDIRDVKALLDKEKHINKQKIIKLLNQSL